MKNNKIIIYDDSCPLCAAYTNGFVATGMIKKENRKSFSSISPGLLNLIDSKRCGNEIPVIDAKTNEVWYGIDGLAEILQTKIPFVKPVLSVKPVKWLLKKTYKFISYNRRVIVASKVKAGNFDCRPDFNYSYRLLFLILFFAFNTAMLLPIHKYILQNSFVSIEESQLMAIHFLLVGFNIIIACFLVPQKAFEYLGQINMLALETIFLTIPLVILNKYLPGYNTINNISILLLICFVFREYHRRLQYAGIVGHYPIIHGLNIIGITGFIIYLIY